MKSLKSLNVGICQAFWEYHYFSIFDLRNYKGALGKLMHHIQSAHATASIKLKFAVFSCCSYSCKTKFIFAFDTENKNPNCVRTSVGSALFVNKWKSDRGTITITMMTDSYGTCEIWRLCNTWEVYELIYSWRTAFPLAHPRCWWLQKTIAQCTTVTEGTELEDNINSNLNCICLD